jgi:hypothetical protein
MLSLRRLSTLCVLLCLQSVPALADTARRLQPICFIAGRLRSLVIAGHQRRLTSLEVYRQVICPWKFLGSGTDPSRMLTESGS